jgi:hypothetical protein
MSDEVLVAQQQQQDRNKESLIDLTNRIYDRHVVTGGREINLPEMVQLSPSLGEVA